MRQDRPEWPSVGDDDHRTGRVPFQNPLDRPDGTSGNSLGRLAVAPSAPDGGGKAIHDLEVGQPLPGAEMLLPQIGVDRHREPVGCRDELGRLPRPNEIARVRGLELRGRELDGKGPRLLDAGGIERHVGVSLDAVIAIPVGLAVPHEQDLGHPITVARMPIVQVTALRQPVGVDLGVVSRAIVLAVSRELGEEASGTWVTWQALEPGAYREGTDDAPLEQPRATHPPLIRVQAFEGRSDDVVARVLSAVAGTVVRELGLEPGNVFVAWDELQAGRLHSGGGMPGT